MKTLFFIILFFSSILSAQNDLLADLESSASSSVAVQPAFKTFKIGNLQSTKVAHKGDLYLYISHRFGTVKDGVETFFGLDQASTKIQLIYGLFEGFHFGLSRESFRKTVAGSVKLRLTQQTSTMPVNVTVYSTANVNTELSKKIYPKLEFGDRWSYASHLLISRRFSRNLSLQIAPTYVRQNLEFTDGHDHDQFALGVGGRMKLSKRVSVNIDYIHNFVRHESSVFNDPLTVGVDIETGGHIFQLLFSNAQSANEPGFISNAAGDWLKGDIFFGFNLVRVF